MEEKEYPSIKDQAKSLAGLLKTIATDTIEGKRLFTTNEEKNERLEICKSCEWYSKETNRCKNCGCYLEKKIAMAASFCPIFKWDRVN